MFTRKVIINKSVITGLHAGLSNVDAIYSEEVRTELGVSEEVQHEKTRLAFDNHFSSHTPAVLDSSSFPLCLLDVLENILQSQERHRFHFTQAATQILI